MEQYKPIGKLKKPTLVYSMGVVLISLPNIGEYINKIQDGLRDYYPVFGKLEITVNSFSADNKSNQETITNYLLNDPDSSWGILISPERIVFHTTSYDGFKDFQGKFQSVLEKIFKITKLKYFSGLAIRHIDNISTIEGETSLSEIIKSNYLTQNIYGGDEEKKTSKHEYKYKIGSRVLASRLYVFETDNGPNVPKDLFPNYISLLGEKAPQIDGAVKHPYVLADFEANNLFNNIAQEFKINNISKELDELHKYASHAYCEIMLPDALKRRG